MTCIWYVSKYVATPTESGEGGRGYLIMRDFAQLGRCCVIITSDSNQLTEVPVLKSAYLREDHDGVQVWWARTLKYQRAKSLRRILSWIHFEWRLLRMPKRQLPKPDAVIVSSLSPLTILNGFLLRRRYRCSLVFEIRDIWPLTIIEEGGFSAKNPLVVGLGLIERIGYRYADAIVGTMPNLAEHVAAVMGQTKPTYCIPMGVDPALLVDGEQLPSSFSERYLPKDKFVVVHAGTIGITNALDTIFDCAESLSDDQRIHFLIVGDGDLRAHYEKRFSHLKNLTFAPRVPKRQVQALLSRCDLLYFSVHPSAVWRYGQSLNKVIDYMLAGKPIVASYSGYPSMINEAACGTFVPAGDVKALQSELQRYASMSAKDRNAMGQRGRDWILAQRRYEALAQNYLKILESVQAQPAPSLSERNS